MGIIAKNSQLLLLEANIPEYEEESAEAENEKSPQVEISINSLTGYFSCFTIRLIGYPLILVDSGSTYCFLNPSLAKQYGCQVASTNQFRVTMADGGIFNGNGKHLNVSLDIQRFLF